MTKLQFEKLNDISKGLAIMSYVCEDETNHWRATLLKQWSTTIDNCLAEISKEKEKTKDES